MGVYDTYGDIQLKVGNVDMGDYQIGDEAPIPDGIYFAPEGAVVIYKGLFVAEISPDAVFDKWGDPVEIGVDLRNPVSQAVRQLVKG